MPKLTLDYLVFFSPRPELIQRLYQSLGFTLTEEQHGTKGPKHVSMTDKKGVVIEIYEGPKKTQTNFRVDDLDTTRALLRQDGTDFVELNQNSIKLPDQDGNEIVIRKE